MLQEEYQYLVVWSSTDTLHSL